mmetsp:Transcript_21247/g.68816  ORF Transcript_21247/g.68816 Transcript_21247/m.68816 type:complete len:206 (-) Transcript_21247:45-662(-)
MCCVLMCSPCHASPSPRRLSTTTRRRTSATTYTATSSTACSRTCTRTSSRRGSVPQFASTTRKSGLGSSSTSPKSSSCTSSRSGSSSLFSSTSPKTSSKSTPSSATTAAPAGTPSRAPCKPSVHASYPPSPPRASTSSAKATPGLTFSCSNLEELPSRRVQKSLSATALEHTSATYRCSIYAPSTTNEQPPSGLSPVRKTPSPPN